MLQDKIQLVKFILVPTRVDYKDIYQRPMRIRATHDTVSSFKEALSGTGKIQENKIANSIPSLVNIGSDNLSSVEIPYGWGTQRLAFIMCVRFPKVGGYEDIYLQGYSDYYDPTFSGRIDDNMLFHINSVVEVLVTDDGTGHSIPRLQNSYNIINNLATLGKKKSILGILDNNQDLVLARPSDILTNMHGQNVNGGNNHIDNIIPGSIPEKTESYISGISGTRGNTSSNTYASERYNSAPVRFISDLYNACSFT